MSEDSAVEFTARLGSLWSRVSNVSINRGFAFRNFGDAFGFATKVALLAEQEGHHPDIQVGWGYVKIVLTTHVAKGLTENDFIMAAKIDKIAEREPLKQS